MADGPDLGAGGGEGKFIPVAMQISSTERGGAQGPPPRDAGALLGGGDQMETGGCSRAGGEMSTGGWQGSGDAVAMSCCTICSPAAAWARLRVGSLHSTALLRNKNPAFVGDVGAPISAFNCLVSSWGLRTPSKGTQMQSPGALLPPFTGREIEGTKRNNEQRWWAGVPRVSPHSRPALRVASAFPLSRWRWPSQPESQTKSWTPSHHRPEIRPCTHSLCRGRKEEESAV